MHAGEDPKDAPVHLLVCIEGTRSHHGPRGIEDAPGDEEEGGISWTYILFDMLFQVLFGVLASVVVAHYSRQREFAADSGAAKLVGADKMRSALERLKQNHPSQLQGSMMAFGIAGGKSMAELFSSHPPLESRISALSK